MRQLHQVRVFGDGSLVGIQARVADFQLRLM